MGLSMVPSVADAVTAWPLAGALNWLGRSGQLYALMPVSLPHLSLNDDDLYVLTHDGKVLWVGGAVDVVGDSASRARFRWALECADHAYSLEAEPGSVERLLMVWDLEAAEPVKGLCVA